MNLEQFQREMAAAVMQPLTVDEGMQSVDTTGRWEGRSMGSVAGGFIRPNSRLTAFERLEIYNRQYWFRLQSAFAEDFPALRAVVGGERFEGLMNGYLAAHPSRSFTLRNLGSELVDWLRQHPDTAGRRHALALDVARVEWAYIEAFDNAVEAPLALGDLGAIGADSRLKLQPHVRLLALEYPADDLVIGLHQRAKREASEGGARPEWTAAGPADSIRLRRRPTWVAVHRVDLSIYYKRLSQAEYRTLAALQSGMNLAESLDAGFAGSTVRAARRIGLVQAWFRNWAELEWLTKPATA